MAKNYKRANDAEGVRAQLCREELIKVEDTMDERMKGESKAYMKKPLIQGVLACQSKCYPIFRPRDEDLELTREPILLLKVEDITIDTVKTILTELEGIGVFGPAD